MNLEQALATGKPFEATHEANMAHNRVELFIDPRYGAYHLELVNDIAKDPFILDTGSLPILKYYLQTELNVDLEADTWIEKTTFSKGSPPLEMLILPPNDQGAGPMNLEQALKSGKPFEANWAANMEQGWIALTVRPQGSAFHLEVVYDITGQPLTLDGDASAITSFIQGEQGIDPTTAIWVEMSASQWPLSAEETDWLVDRREV